VNLCFIFSFACRLFVNSSHSVPIGSRRLYDVAAKCQSAIKNVAFAQGIIDDVYKEIVLNLGTFEFFESFPALVFTY
jgi:hypothetical protein